MITNLTEGQPSKILWKFTIPMLLSVAFQQLYSIIDSMIAGRFVGSDALAAVGVSYPITMLFIAVATGSNVGTSVVVSTIFGAGKYGKMKSAIYTALISITVLAIILTVVGFAVCTPIMHLLQTPADIYEDSATYLQIYMLGIIFMFLYNISGGVFTALGDSNTPLYLLIGSSVGNIVLDLLFVIQFRMGVAGVAWATLIAQAVSAMLALCIILKRLNHFTTAIHFPVFSPAMLKRMTKIAVPSILQQSFVSVGNLFLQTKINSFGSDVIAGYSAAIKLNVFAITCFNTISNSISSFTAQNLGARQIERVKKAIRVSYSMIFLVTAPFVICYFFFGPQLMELFVKGESKAVIQVGTIFLKIVSPFYLIIALKIVVDGVMRGAAEMFPFVLSTLLDFITRIVLAYVLADVLHSSTGIWMAWPFSWIVGTGVSYSYFLRGTWKRRYSPGVN